MTLSGTPASECNLRGDWGSPLGQCPSCRPSATHFDAQVSQTAKDASSSREKLIEIFNRIERFFHRLEIYTGITPTAAMRDIIIEIMVEVLAILAIATKEVKRGRFSRSTLHAWIHDSCLTRRLERFLKTLMGNTDIEGSLDKLDKLTQEEARMASAELLKMTHSVDGKVMGVDDRVKGVEGKVQDVRDNIQDVRDDVRSGVQDVLDDVQDVRGDVQDVGNQVQGVDDKVQGIGIEVKDKLDEVNRSLSLQHLLLVANAQIASQGTNSEIVFHDGCRPQIHPPIITTRAKLATTAQPNGFSKEAYSINGNPPDPSCGYTENVCDSRPSGGPHQKSTSDYLLIL